MSRTYSARKASDCSSPVHSLELPGGQEAAPSRQSGVTGSVDQVVSDDVWLVYVAPGNLFPYGHQLVLIRVGLRPETSHAVAVADLAMVLPAGRGVHIQNEIDLVLAAPVEKVVDYFKPALDERSGIGVEEQVVMHGQANMIESPLGDGCNIFFRDVFGPIQFEETIRSVLADQVHYLCPDGTRRAAIGGENMNQCILPARASRPAPSRV